MQPSWNDYEIVETIGEGTYGKVYKVKSKNWIASFDAFDSPLKNEEELP
jgi:serine/threonine protein kinase